MTGCSRFTSGPRGVLAIVALAALSASPRGASAEGAAERAATAQGLYDTAADRMKTGKFSEACPKLEESLKLDPMMGTRFFLAVCYESTGRPTTAWSLYFEVARTAKAAGNALREATARGRAAALEPKLPRITVVVADASAALPGLSVRRDDARLDPVVWGSSIPVDFGVHKVSASAPGKATWTTNVLVYGLGQRIEVRVPALKDASTTDALSDAAPGPPGDDGPTPEAHAGMAGRVAALVVGGAGIAGLAVGGALGLLTRSAWSQATAACPAQTTCSADAHAESDHALSLATGSTVAFAIGGAAVATGIVLWITAPSPKATARIRLGPLGAAVTGEF